MHVEGTWSAGGNRHNPWYSRVYVESSYIARGQQVRMERYCGVALVKSAPEEAWDYGLDRLVLALAAGR